MIILIDNYDSFTYNIVQYLGDLGAELSVYRNDALTAQDVIDKKPSGIVLSPGPSNPDQAGICLDLVSLAAKHEVPLLGICLGHQTIGQAFGGSIVKTNPLHGKTSTITHENKGLFQGLPTSLEIARYHSLVIDPPTCPDCLEITAQTQDGIIMGVQHEVLPIHGVQFHPESIATENGHDMIDNFLKITKG